MKYESHCYSLCAPLYRTYTCTPHLSQYLKFEQPLHLPVMCGNGARLSNYWSLIFTNKFSIRMLSYHGLATNP